MEPQPENRKQYAGESETLLNFPERMNEPVAVVSYGYVEGELVVNRVGAFRSGKELQQYVADVAARTGGFQEDFTIRTRDSEITYKAIPLGSTLDTAGDKQPVAVFRRDQITGEPTAMGVYESLQDFRDLLDFEKEFFLGKDLNMGFSQSGDALVTHQSVEDQGYIVVSTGEFVR